MAHSLAFAFNPRSEAAPAHLFVKSLGAILAVIDAVDYSLYQAKQRDNWYIEKLESSSPTVRLYPKRNGFDVVAVIGDGLRMLNESAFEPPSHFTEEALLRIQKMRPMLKEKSLLSSIDVAVDSEHVTQITKRTVENAKQILRVGYSNLGSIQGRLEAINIHRSPLGTVWDRVSGAPVRFSFARHDIDEVKSLVDKRVRISGNVSYFANGTPRAIADVISIENATYDDRLPTAEFGSIPDAGIREMGAAAALRSTWERRES